jgi:hypothetical protein
MSGDAFEYSAKHPVDFMAGSCPVGSGRVPKLMYKVRSRHKPASSLYVRKNNRPDLTERSTSQARAVRGHRNSPGESISIEPLASVC